MIQVRLYGTYVNEDELSLTQKFGNDNMIRRDVMYMERMDDK